jgi:hypothetical protein
MHQSWMSAVILIAVSCLGLTPGCGARPPPVVQAPGGGSASPGASEPSDPDDVCADPDLLDGLDAPCFVDEDHGVCRSESGERLDCWPRP